MNIKGPTTPASSSFLMLRASIRRPVTVVQLVACNSGMWSTNAATDVGVLPLDGLGCLVVLPDVAEELAAEVGGRDEDAAGDEIALDLAQPELSQANAKLVYRTVLAVDDPESARHVVPLKLRKAVKPLFRKVGYV